jgi:hypothetical protein
MATLVEVDGVSPTIGVDLRRRYLATHTAGARP